MDESALRTLAPSPDVFSAGAQLLRKGSLQGLRQTADQLFVWGECQGSGATPYQVSADLKTEQPTVRCSCPSRKFPCKHGMALLLAKLEGASAFAEAELPADLAEKRAKGDAKAAKAADPQTPAKPRKAAKPNLAAQAKKVEAQLKGIELAELVIADLARSGLGVLDAAGREALAGRAKELADFHLPGLALAVRRLVGALEADGEVAEKSALATQHFVTLTAMSRKGRAVLESKQEEPGALDESDAVVEELLGKVWQLDELKAKGFVRGPLQLLELAYTSYADDAREERIQTSLLLELASGDVHRDVALVPLRRVSKEPEKASYRSVQVKEAAIYPGFLNRRIRWEKGEGADEPTTPAMLTSALERALPIAEALKRFSGQVRNLLAPRSAALLVQVEQLALAEHAAVIRDAAGTALTLESLDELDGALTTLRTVGRPAGRLAMLVEFTVRGDGARVLARPHSWVTAHGVVRLSY